ncbi:hypothetical protein IV203_010543 [Nitzschia inconspicua]|uniref:N-acetylgalactosaminide beta-1,3-galactosyltransferase n=1 Tax=Nitzschia inconspicua TaxID=303405 RepID=A0A9K3KXS1_9STRA|nr:hypothetical protein IV203_010543 [Nitzschia inconspicua]
MSRKPYNKRDMNGVATPNYNNGVSNPMMSTPEFKVRLFLFVACLWHLWVLALFGASAPGHNQQIATTSSTDNDTSKNAVSSPAAAMSNARLNLRSVLDRVDVMGYGPTHPRVAVVIVGEDKEDLIASIKSVYANTDINRIFVVCAVLDGHQEDPEFVRELRNVDNGSVPHWHGIRADVHLPGTNQAAQEDDPHSKEIHVMFNPTRLGVAASRLDAVEFVQILEKKHISAGFKSLDEDLILLLMQGGAQLKSHNWLAETTSALIVPPPILGFKDESLAMKVANAVSFHTEGFGKRTSFDEKFSPIITEATADEINLSNGHSFPTPALNGAAVALRLDTFANLPAQDPSLMDPWTANLDLSLNLWLCADGIDIIEEVEVSPPMVENPTTTLNPDQAARFAAVWMDEMLQQKFFQAYSSTWTRLDWETKVTKVKQSATTPSDLARRCRSFEWYAKEVNPNLSKILEMGGWEHDHEKEIAEKQNVSKEAEKETHNLKPPPLLERKDEEEKNPPPVNDIPDLAGHDKKKPSKPLRPENLNIVSQAKPINIEFEDASDGHEAHPHLGAMDENGHVGYIHDETALRKNPPTLKIDDEQMAKFCKSRDDNYKMMHNRIVVDMEYDKKMEDSGVKRDKIFCLVYTIDSGHPKIPNILETWGPKCDGFMVGSNKTDPSLGTVNILHEGPEEYNNIWQKVRSMWSYIYDNYYERYDWFHIGGDDLFLLIENLRLYLESEEIKTASNGGIYLPDGTETTQTPLLLGRRFAYMGDLNDIFDSGGSGYTMNKAALKLLVTEGFVNYFPHAHTFSEDTMVAKVLRKMGVLPYDTKDDDGGERYMPFMPGHHWSYRLPKDPMNSKDWYAKYSINIKEGAEHCSPRSVAFHYVKGENMKRLFALAYGLCPKEYLD